MQQSIRIYYSICIWSSTCFVRHTAHHQELKPAPAASGFAYVKGCGRWGCWTLTASSNLNVHNLSRMQIRGCWGSFELLMMGGVSPETCWASYKHGIINFDTLLHLIGYFCVNCILEVRMFSQGASYCHLVPLSLLINDVSNYCVT